MGMKRALRGMAAILCLALASCTIAGRAVIRNASGAELLLWPLAAQPVPLRSEETTNPIVFTAHERHQAMIARDSCLYTYPAPDYFALPKRLRSYAARVVVVIEPDMSLHVHERSKQGVEGPEIVGAGFPIQPASFCGRPGRG